MWRGLALMVPLIGCAAAGLEKLFGAPLRVCVTLDSGFDMLVDPSMPIANVTRESQLYGFNVDARLYIIPTALSSKNSSYELRVLGSYGELMVATRRDECDVGWATYFYTGNRDRCGRTVRDLDTCRPLEELTIDSSWTPWRCCVDFSPPFMTYGLNIMYDAAHPGFFESLFQSIAAPFTVNFGSFTFILTIIVAHFIWLFERKANSEQFPERYLDGIDDAVWWAIVTLTTVGYGDKVPITPAGRVVGLLWMVIGLCLSAILIGSMSTTFNEVSQGTATINSVHALVEGDYKVCSYATSFASGEVLAAVPSPNRVEGSGMAECAAWFEAKTPTDKFAIVLDGPVMRHWRSITPWARGLIISDKINTYLVSVIYPEGVTTLSNRLNPAIVDFYYSGEHASLSERWFPLSAGQGQSSSGLEWSVVGPAIGAVLLYISVVALSIFLPKPDVAAVSIVSGTTRKLVKRLSCQDITLPSMTSSPSSATNAGEDITLQSAKGELSSPAPSYAPVKGDV